MDSAQNYIIRLMNDPGRNLCASESRCNRIEIALCRIAECHFRMFERSYKKHWYINTSNMLLECKNNHNPDHLPRVNDEKQREKLKSITF